MKITDQIKLDKNQEFQDDIEEIIHRLKDKLDNSDLQKCSTAWKEFINIKQKEDKSFQGLSNKICVN